MNDELPGLAPEDEMTSPRKVILWGEQASVFEKSSMALSGGLVCRIATLPQCGLEKIMRAMVAKMGKSGSPVAFYECMLEEKIDLELLSLLKSQYPGKWAQKLTMSRSECLDHLVSRFLDKGIAGLVVHRVDLASNGLIECLLQIKKRMDLKGKSFGLIFGEEVKDQHADEWQSRISDTIAQASFALSGLDLSGLMGYMGKALPESSPFIAGFKRGDGKYMEAAHELFEYTRGRTDVLDNLIRTVKIFFPGEELTLEVLCGARSILAQPSLLLIPHGIAPDRE